MMKHLKKAKPGNGEIHFTFGDLDLNVAEAMVTAFADVNCVSAVSGNLLKLKADAIISPANSFGDMGGGIDKAIDDYHSGGAQQRVREVLGKNFYGEIPVGAAQVVKLSKRNLGIVIVAPTMRIPGAISGSQDPR